MIYNLTLTNHINYYINVIMILIILMIIMILIIIIYRSDNLTIIGTLWVEDNLRLLLIHDLRVIYYYFDLIALISSHIIITIMIMMMLMIIIIIVMIMVVIICFGYYNIYYKYVSHISYTHVHI